MQMTTGWRRLIECLLQVIFRKRATDYRALLWKITSKDKASHASSPLCTSVMAIMKGFTVASQPKRSDK